jgi:transposase
MTEELTITDERVDDTPFLMAHMKRMTIPRLLDKCFPTHGNWEGLSLGWVAAGWLSHILSEGDHRMNHVQPWAEKRLETLSKCMGQPVRALDFSDDCLALVLRTLSADERWKDFERKLNGHLLRVYPLKPKSVRIDTTTCSGYWSVTPEGLFQFGFSKDHRPDLPQAKVVLSALDPLGMPVATDVVSGSRADDPLYIPAIRRVQASLQTQGLLYIGDAKMSAAETRAFVEATYDFYLSPLTRVQVPQEELERYLEPVWEGKQDLVSVQRENAAGEQKRIAEGYEWQTLMAAEAQGKTIQWTERRLVIRSMRQRRAAETRLRKKLDRAQTALEALNERGRGKKRYRSLAELRQAAEELVKEHKVEGLLNLGFYVRFHRRRVRHYGDRPTRIVVEQDPGLVVQVNEIAVREVLRRKGWRVYVTNAPKSELPLSQAVLAYRNQYIVERGCGRLKGRPLSLRPMYLERDDHATGLIRLLTIGLRVLTLLEFVVRQRLAQEGTDLAGVYAGNPKRSTARPSAELLLEAFEDITLIVIQEPHRDLHHLTPLSETQKRILDLSGFSSEIYTSLCVQSSKPP